MHKNSRKSSGSCCRSQKKHSIRALLPGHFWEFLEHLPPQEFFGGSKCFVLCAFFCSLDTQAVKHTSESAKRSARTRECPPQAPSRSFGLLRLLALWERRAATGPERSNHLSGGVRVWPCVPFQAVKVRISVDSQLRTQLTKQPPQSSL